ncbi:MAG: HAMP domain-containing histidine kinase [Prevotellaceae bacterium]|nr:HAMP domain-containing histidine kinase [Candidatus Faecinaster equi]
MKWLQKAKLVKYLFISCALIIAIISLIFSHFLVKDLEKDAKEKMSVWAEAMHTLNNADEYTDMNLVLKIINTNNTIPVAVLNRKGDIMMHRNIDDIPNNPQDSVIYIQKEVNSMKIHGYSLKIDYPTETTTDDFLEIIYDDSSVMKRLQIYPYIQIAVLTIFILAIIFSIIWLQRAEQNRLWVGLSKETAHQLGTPISSLMAWNEILKDNYPDEPIINEINKDVDRLNLIAERFSKIGSKPDSQEKDLNTIIIHVAAYISKRSSEKVKISCNLPSTPVMIKMNAPLFEWVIENLCKNAIDAMSGNGNIIITAHEIKNLVIIEVSDTGKGIAKNRFKSVFSPGYTTKSRGWGLGLSLAKRIIEHYHNGKIFVKKSELGKGTTFRIELKK